VQIERYCKRMQAGDLYTLLAAMITQRPWDDIVSDDIGRCVCDKHLPGNPALDVSDSEVTFLAWYVVFMS
jgi:hypothetical protein